MAASVGAEAKALTKHPAHLENVFHNVPGGVIVTDGEGRSHNMNETARSLLGEPSDAVALRDWPRVFRLYLQDGVTPFPAESLPPIRVLEGVRDVPAVHMLLHSNADNKIHRISMSAGAIAARDGTIDGITILFQEVTQQPELEAPDDRHAEGLERF